jgi:hypothetical protein
MEARVKSLTRRHRDTETQRRKSFLKKFSSLLCVSVSLGLCVPLFLLAHPVSAAKVSTQQADGFNPASIKTAAFLPFIRVTPSEGTLLAICPLTQTSHEACKLDDAAEAELSRAIGAALALAGDSVSWVSQEEINAARARMKTGDGAALSTGGPMQLALGRELGVDAVLFGFVYCYRNRGGAALASGTPAAIGYCLHLVDVKSGAVLWSFSYRDEQAALFDNLLTAPEFIKRKGQWITAEKMADESARALAAALPWRGRPAGKKR